MSTRVRLAVAYAAATAITVVVVATGALVLYRWSFDREVRAGVALDVERVAEVVADRGVGALHSATGSELLEGEWGRTAVVDGRGRVIAGRRPGDGARVSRAVVDPGGRDFVVVGTAPAAEGGATRGLGLVLVLAPVGTLVFAAAGGFVLASRALRPVEAAYAHERRFVADAAHELRSPVTFLRLGIEEVRQQPSPPSAEQIEALGAEIARLDRLVRELLELSRLESSVAPPRERVDVRALAADAVARFEPLAQARGLALSLEAPDREVLGLGTREGIERILTVLLDNAFAYTDEGSVTVRVRGVPRPAVEVADTGRGIGEEDQRAIFGRFTTTAASRSRVSGEGLGLGLAIADAAARAMGAEITLRSRPGEGSCFALVLHPA